MSLPPELYAETIIGSRKRLLEDEAMYDRYTLASSGIGSSSRNVSESPSLKRQHTSVLVDDAASASVQGTMVPFDRRADVPKSPAVVPSHASWFVFFFFVCLFMLLIFLFSVSPLLVWQVELIFR